MFAGTFLTAIIALLLFFYIIYPLLKRIVPTNLIWVADVIIAFLIIGMGVGLISTVKVHLILVGMFIIVLGAFTLLLFSKYRT